MPARRRATSKERSHLPMNGSGLSGQWKLWVVATLLAANVSLLGLVWNALTWRLSVGETRIDNLLADQRLRGERMATIEARLQSVDGALTLTRSDFNRLETKIDAVRDKIERIVTRGQR